MPGMHTQVCSTSTGFIKPSMYKWVIATATNHVLSGDLLKRSKCLVETKGTNTLW